MMAEKPPVGRFAPTPSGRMHLGNVFAAMVAWLSVRSRGGELVLRMEDLDTQRTSEENARILREDLLWLGLDWDRETPPQSQRSAVYDRYFDILQQKGLLYPCYCTRSQLHNVNAPHLSDGTYVYPGTCRNLTTPPADRKPAWRVKVPQRVYSLEDMGMGPFCQDLSADCGDFVVRRADGVYVYQLYLQELFGFPHPTYGHVPMLMAPDGRRLSKRDQDLDLGQLRLRCKPEQLIGTLAYSAGLLEKPQAISARELSSIFTWNKLRRQDILLDGESLFV